MSRFRKTLKFFVCAGYVELMVDQGSFPALHTCYLKQEDGYIRSA